MMTMGVLTLRVVWELHVGSLGGGRRPRLQVTHCFGEGGGGQMLLPGVQQRQCVTQILQTEERTRLVREQSEDGNIVDQVSPPSQCPPWQ